MINHKNTKILGLYLLLFASLANAQQFQCKWEVRKVEGGNFQPFPLNSVFPLEKTSSYLKFNDNTYGNPSVDRTPDGSIRTRYFQKNEDGVIWQATFGIMANGQTQLYLTDSKTKAVVAGICFQR